MAEIDLEVEKLANDIDDVTDPSSYDKVLAYFDDLKIEAEEYMLLLVETLEFRDITWGQPWYQANSPMGKPYKPFYDRNETEIETEKFRTDKITKDEHDKISKNWKRFTKKYKVPDKLRLFAGWKNYHRIKAGPEERTRRFVVAYLARGLKRTLEQVFTYIKCYNLKDFKTKSYNKNEEKVMEVCFIHRFEKATRILALVLGRNPRGLNRRKTASKAGTQEKRPKKKKWTLIRAGKLLKGLLQHSELPLHELEYKTFDKPFWLKIQEEMDTDYNYLQFFWYYYLHVQLFVTCDVKLYKLRRKIFKILRDSPYLIWKDVRWAEVLKHFPDGFTKQFLYKMCFSIVRKHPRYLKTPVSDLANFGLKTIKSFRYTNKRLKRLTVDDEGNLVVIKHT